MTEQKIFLHNSVDFWNIRIRHSMASGKDRYERGGCYNMLLVHTYILLPHAVTKYGAHADITRRKMRGYDAFALQKQTHPTPTGSPPPPKCAARVGNIYARLTFDMLIRALIGPLIDRVTRYCQF